MVYYEKTGLPYLYLEKLLILKKIFEQLENSKIQTLLVFRDNKELENERLKKNLNNLKLFKFKNKFDPYFVEFTLENVNLKNITRNFKGEIIPSYLFKKFKELNLIYTEEMQKQILFDTKEMLYLKDILKIPESFKLKYHNKILKFNLLKKYINIYVSKDTNLILKIDLNSYFNNENLKFYFKESGKLKSFNLKKAELFPLKYINTQDINLN